MYGASPAKAIEMPFRGLIHVGLRNHYYKGSRLPHGKRQFLGLSGQTKIIGSLCCGVRSKSEHSIPNNGTACNAVFRQFFGPIVVKKNFTTVCKDDDGCFA